MLRLSLLGLFSVLISALPLNDHVVQKRVPQGISFEEKGSVHGVTVDGCEFSSTGWQSSDGVVVFLKIYYCKPANAQEVWNRLTSEATKVFEKKALTKDGKQTGERIIASFSKGLVKRPEMILWTDGDDIYIVDSKSIEHALVFEKRYPNV
jgi:hypothetical protein